MRQYIWLAHGRHMRHLLVAWCVCYAGDLAAFTAASEGLTSANVAADCATLAAAFGGPALAAVTGNPESVDSADEVISTWLGSG